jgi:hypothetical protein
LITAVSISQTPVRWNLPNVPFHCLTEDGPKWPLRVKSKSRIEYLAAKQNRAIEKALELYPETSQILWIDSYYLDQTGAIETLIRDYLVHSTKAGDSIVGGPILCHNRTRIFYKVTYYDTWSTPEYDGKRWSKGWFDDNDSRSRDFEIVSGVGGVYLFPRYVWEKVGYRAPEPFPQSGCQHNWLCRESGLRVYLDWNLAFWRSVTYPPIQRLRCSIGEFLRKNPIGI